MLIYWKFQVYLPNNIVLMEKKKLQGIQITELFLVKSGNDFTRTFIGEIRREIDDIGDEIVRGSVIIEEGKAWSKASSQEELMKNMDAICLLKLEKGLHSNVGLSIEIFEGSFFLN